MLSHNVLITRQHRARRARCLGPVAALALSAGALCPAATQAWFFPATVICPGDCNDDGATTIDELLTGVAINLGREPSSACPAMDDVPDSTVQVSEIVAAVESSLQGCPAARWVPSSCFLFSAPQINCGDLLVPENPTAHNGRTVRLRTVILPATGPDRQPDPFVFLTGGPGNSALNNTYLGSLATDFAAPIRTNRDIVIFDQRGTGLSSPTLDCPEVPPFYASLGEPLTPEEEATRELNEARTCGDRLAASGVDLTAYDSAATARDIGDLMTALHYDRFNLYGLSYGTRVALTALRDLPGDRIRSVVLDSAAPPQVNLVSGEAAAALQRSLDLMFADCASSPSCNAAYPNLKQTTFDLVEHLNAVPLLLDPTAPDGTPFHVVLTGDRLLRLISLGLQQNSLIPFVPLLVTSVARDDTLLITTALTALAAPDNNSTGVTYAVLCNEETPFNTPEVMAAANLDVDPVLARAMAADPRGGFCPWNSPPANPIENQPVSSDVPALVLAGEYDTSTPPRFSQLAASTLSHSDYVAFRGFGHIVLGQELTPDGTPSCAMQVIAAFIADPTRAPDRSCVDALPPVQFIGG